MGHRSTGHLDDLGEPVAKIKAKKRQIEEERTWVSWRSSPNKESKIDEEKTKSLEAKNRKRASRGNGGRREGVQRRHEPNKNDLRASKARKTASLPLIGSLPLVRRLPEGNCFQQREYTIVM